MTRKAKNPVQSDLTALEILETVERIGGGSIQSIAEESGITESTVHNHLSTLRQEGYIIKRDGSYHLGLRFLELGESARNREPLFSFARPEVDKLANETGELANLSTFENGRGVYLYRTQGEPEIRFSTDAGERHDLHCTATGKAMLAYFPESLLDLMISEHGLTSHTENTITDRDELEDDLAEIREQQLALDLEEYERGLRCVASPILDKNDRAIGAISLSGPVMKFSGEYYRKELAEAVKSAANVVSLNIARANNTPY